MEHQIFLIGKPENPLFSIAMFVYQRVLNREAHLQHPETFRHPKVSGKLSVKKYADRLEKESKKPELINII